MINLFLLHAPEDTACAQTLRTSLESQGYHLWRKPHSLQANTLREPRTTEGALLGSTVVLLLWSRNAAHSDEVTRQIPLILDLKKTILPLLLDQTELPVALQRFTSFVVAAHSTDVAAQLVQQALLPPPDRVDPLFRLAELAASNHLTDRKAAVKQAEMMLQHNDHRSEVHAILTYLAQDDPMIGVREPAQEALDADARRQQPSPLLPFQQTNASDMIDVRCKKCGHVTHFNKHRICKESRTIVRGDKDKLKLKCENCGEMMMVNIDCEGYK
jgi:TIR domain